MSDQNSDLGIISDAILGTDSDSADAIETPAVEVVTFPEGCTFAGFDSDGALVSFFSFGSIETADDEGFITSTPALLPADIDAKYIRTVADKMIVSAKNAKQSAKESAQAETLAKLQLKMAIVQAEMAATAAKVAKDSAALEEAKGDLLARKAELARLMHGEDVPALEARLADASAEETDSEGTGDSDPNE